MIRRALLLGACLALPPTVSQAAMLMLVDGVPGPAAVHQSYIGWFSVDATAWGIDRLSSATPHSLTVSLESSATVATIMQASASGAAFKRIVIDEVAIGGSIPVQLFLRLTCDEALVGQFSSSSNSSARSKVQLDIRCGRLSWESFDYTSQGVLARSAKGSWNFKSNTP